MIEFVTALSAPNVNQLAARDDEADVIGKDYNRYASKYFVSENETYASDKRIIVEDYFRQSALAPKNSPHTDVPTSEAAPYASTNVNTSTSSTNVNLEDNESEAAGVVSSKRDKHSVTDEGNRAPHTRCGGGK